MQPFERDALMAGAEGFDVLVASDFETPFQVVQRMRLLSGGRIDVHRHDASDECIVVLKGSPTVARNESMADVDAPAVALFPAGDVHGVFNRTKKPVDLLRIVVAMEAGVVDVPGEADDIVEKVEFGSPDHVADALDRSLLGASKAHHGLGEIRFRRVFDHPRFSTNWGFVDHAVVPPNTSVGYHRHDTVQECYVMLDGSGLMKVDGEVAEVVTGDCVPNHIGGSHGIVNHRLAPLEFLNLAVFQRRGVFDATDLGDDLSGLL